MRIFGIEMQNLRLNRKPGAPAASVKMWPSWYQGVV